MWRPGSASCLVAGCVEFGGASGDYSYSYWYGALASRPEASLTLLEPSTCRVCDLVATVYQPSRL
eukprot:scaffold513607_cov31-Prasinocladus_malaysianus.AAC.1